MGTLRSGSKTPVEHIGGLIHMPFIKEVERIIKVEVPVDHIVEVIKEVPVDRIVEVIKEVRVEVPTIITKIEKVPATLIKEVEKIVEKPIEVIREVPVEVLHVVEKEIEKLKIPMWAWCLIGSEATVIALLLLLK